jgi:YrbI family 3-deoxy-D-manno-octulosonate 8-phosphate phosphatase
MRPLPSSVDLIVFDFDGVFTDNKVFVDENGTESVVCDRRDGLGIAMLRALAFPMIIVSTEENKVVSARAKKLKLVAYQGCANKREFVLQYLREKHLQATNTFYVGNDTNDLEAMAVCGYGVAPSDAHPKILAIADKTLRSSGGHGAVREFAEFIIEKFS